MQKHTMKRICRVADINAEFLTFRLTKEQRAKANGAKISFRKSTQRYEGYRQLLARAEYNKLNPATGKKHAAPVASKLIGIIWDDDPDWVYETDKTKSSKPERRKQAIAKRFESQRNLTTQVASLFTEDIEYQVSAVQVKKIPVPLFLTVAVICACRGLTDATSVANYWNNNLTSLRNLFPSYELEVISHDTVRRIYMSLTENSVRNFMKNFYDWLPKWSDGERRHYAVDGQSCRASRHFETNRRMMTLNAVDITAGKLCSSHLMISTKSHEPKYAPELLADFQIHGATVTLDALNDENTKYNVDVLKKFIDNKNDFGFIAKINNKIVGFAFGYILLKPDGRKVFYLDAIDVMPDYQGKGYGTGLISFARDYAKTIDCYKMYLITNRSNISACKCYEKAGGINKVDDEIIYGNFRKFDVGKRVQ